MSESTLQKISRKTGKKLIECKCQQCAMQCKTPCLPTPEDVQALVNAGYSYRLRETDWWAGVVIGVTDRPVPMIAPELEEKKGACTFFHNGLCELHDKGLKPTEGKLSHHTTTAANFDPKKSLSWAVAKEWIGKCSDLEYYIQNKTP